MCKIKDMEDKVEFNNCVLIGSNLIAKESGEVVVGNKYSQLRLRSNGQIIINDKLVTNDSQLKSQLEMFIRELTNTHYYG